MQVITHYEQEENDHLEIIFTFFIFMSQIFSQLSSYSSHFTKISHTKKYCRNNIFSKTEYFQGKSQSDFWETTGISDKIFFPLKKISPNLRNPLAGNASYMKENRF